MPPPGRVPLFGDHGAFSGTYSGGSPATLSCAGHISAGMLTLIVLMDPTGGVWGPQPLDGANLTSLAADKVPNLYLPMPLADSKGNTWRIDGGWFSGTYTTVWVISSFLTTALAPGDSVPVAFVNGPASFSYHSVQLIGPTPTDPKFQSAVPEWVNSGVLSVVPEPAGPGQGPFGHYLSIHCRKATATVSADSEWQELFAGAGGGAIIEYLTYNQPERTSTIHSVSTNSSGAGGGMSVWYECEPTWMSAPGLLEYTHVPGVLVPDDTFPGGQRLDADLYVTAPAEIEMGEASGVCNSGAPVGKAQTWWWDKSAVNSLDGGRTYQLPGKQLNPPEPWFGTDAVYGGQLPGGTPADWWWLLTFYPVAFPEGSEIDVTPARMELTISTTTYLEPAYTQACGGPVVYAPALTEGLALFIFETDDYNVRTGAPPAIGVGDVYLDGVLIVSNGPLRYDSVLAGRTLTFVYAEDVPAGGVQGVHYPDMALVTLDEGTWKHLTCPTFTMHMTLWFPAPPPSPPIHVEPLPEEGPDLGPPPTSPTQLIVSGALSPGPGRGGEIRESDL